MALILMPALVTAQAKEAATLSIIADRSPGRAAIHGLEKLKLALREKGVVVKGAANLDAAQGDILIVAGMSQGSGAAAGALKAAGVTPPKAAESLLIRNGQRQGKKLLTVCGADDRGLMYALLDVADRVGWSKNTRNPLSEVRDTAEKPAVAQRAVSIYTMNRRIECIGSTIKVWVNGVPTCHLVDEKYRQGFIAFKIHSAGSKPITTPAAVRLKNIRVITEHPERHIQPMDLPPRHAPATPGRYDKATPQPATTPKAPTP